MSCKNSSRLACQQLVMGKLTLSRDESIEFEDSV